MRHLASSLALLVVVASCNATTVPASAAGSIATANQASRPIAKPPTIPPKTVVKKPGGGTSPTEPAQEAGREIGALAGTTAEHNKLRAAVGVAALEWKNELGAYAQTWANHIAANNCQLAHRSGDSYGENLYWASGGQKTPVQVVGLWAAEKASYDHATNSCAQGQICGHYTQIVWSSTKYVGCGRATCNGGEVWVCNYDPQGNFNGQSPY